MKSEIENNKKTMDKLTQRLNDLCLETAETPETVAEMNKIIKEIESLAEDEQNPQADPQEAYRRFKQKYHNTTEKTTQMEASSELAVSMEEFSKARKKKTNFILEHKAVYRLVLAAAAIFVLFTVANVGSYATSKKGIFSFIKENKDSRSFFVEAENEPMEMGEIDKNQYTLEVFRQENPDIPFAIEEQYLTDYNIEEVKKINMDTKDMYMLLYHKSEYENFKVTIERFKDTLSWVMAANVDTNFVEKSYIDSWEVSIYTSDDSIMAWFFDNKDAYTLRGDITKEKMIEIIEEMISGKK